MIIRELNIKGFGRHSDKKIELSDGINIIYGENESGKSTLAAFIHAMMYGVEKKRGKPSPDSIYGRYQPVKEQWSGSMKFEYEGRMYEIFRNFPDVKKPVVIDLATGLMVDFEEIKDAFGEEKVFDSTLYISQDKNDDSGKLIENVSGYVQRVSGGRDEQLDVRESKKKLKNLVKELEVRCEEEEKLLKELMDKKEKAEKISEEYNCQAQRVDELRKGISLKNEDKEKKVESLKEYTSRFDQIELLYEKYCMNKKNVELVVEMELANQQKGLKVGRRAKAAYYCMLMVALISVMTIIFLLPVNMPVKIALGVVSVLILGVVNFMWDSRIIRKLAGHFIQNETNARVTESENCRKIIEEIEEIKAEIEEYGRGSVSSFTVSDEGMEVLRRSVAELEESVERYYKMENERVTNLSREIDRGEWLLSDVVRRLNGENAESLGKECEECRERIAACRKKINAAKMAENIIAQISTELGGDFKVGILKEFSENVSAFTKGSYDRVVLDDNMGIKVHKNTDFVDISKLSYGTVKQIYLALRLSVARWLEQYNMPMVIDDGFVFFDNDRLKETLKGLKGQHKGQIIIFTCHKREEEMLHSLGIAYECIKL